MATARVTITKAGRNDVTGIPLAVGTTYTLDYDFAKSLWMQRYATDTDSIFTIGERSGDFVYDARGTQVLGASNPDDTATMISRCYGSGLPFVMPANGNITSTSGGITVGTAFDYIIGPSYAYFPANALNASSAAGWYYTVWSSTTVGIIYAETYTNGSAQIPAYPSTLTTVVAAYTQVTAFDVVGPNFVIPGGYLGNNGVIEFSRSVNNNNSAGGKIYSVYFGGTVQQGLTQTTNPKYGIYGTIRNRGIETRQLSVSGSTGDPGAASSLPKSAIDTRSDQIISFTMQLAVATDYAITEGHHVRANKIY
jgi:hypothetical protein